MTYITPLPFLFSTHFHVSYSNQPIAFTSGSTALMFFSALFSFLYSALFPPSNTARSSGIAAREDKEAPRGGSHKPRCPLQWKAYARRKHATRPLRHRHLCRPHPTLCDAPPSSAPLTNTSVTSTHQPPSLCAHRTLVLPPHPPSVRRHPALRCRRAHR
jgi:hypothetical protein